MLVFVNNTVKQAIVAFRGSCSSLASQCRADKCYLSHAEVFGVYTPFLVGTDLSLGCDDFSESDLDYVQQADSAVRRVQKTLPGLFAAYRTLTGSSPCNRDSCTAAWSTQGSWIVTISIPQGYDRNNGLFR